MAGCGKKDEPAPAPTPATSATAPAPTAAAPAPAPAGAEVVRIGHVAPMSGPQAHYGKDNENGVRMAIEELNTQNISIGGKPVRFEIQAEDDAADPKQGTAAAQKLCDAKVAGVVGHLNSGTTIPAAKVYNDCGIPHITGAATNPELTKPGYKTTYRLIANDNALGAALALHAADQLKLKKVAVIDDRTAYGQGVADIFSKTAEGKGVQVVDRQFTNDKATDFMAILTAIKAKKPDAIFYGGMDAQGGPMLRQLEQLGLTDVKFFGGDGICTAEIAKLAAGAKTLNNVVCAEGGASIAKMPGGAAWKQRYDQKFPGQFQIYSPYTYDATFVLVDAMKRANSTDPKAYLPKLAETDYQGVTARIQFEPGGELKNAATTLYTYKDGKKQAIE
ncbi:branched-chain amino acid ABC transporter substrate-binding protein [Caenimonas sedimenti]|uniref:Branched-chain amino acid ABC transporter substrate-binding protein n=1 Tax=Caenimonas sedimenti TaxID=2596921 RepID=A0A562ZQR2_9BURK|nr:branched-chain amino acid ABC transporter substrate-binding protein [Caenimonas sedimenti]